MKENILILVNSFISCSKKQYFKTQLINTEHRTQNTDTEHRTQTHVKNGLMSTVLFRVRVPITNMQMLLRILIE